MEVYSVLEIKDMWSREKSPLWDLCAREWLIYGKFRYTDVNLWTVCV